MTPILLFFSLIFQNGCAIDSWNFAGVNIAKGKHATNLPNTLNSYFAGKAVDGNIVRNFKGSTCSHTTQQDNVKKSWTVELGGVYTLKGLRFYTRADCCRERHEHFKIIGGPSNTTLHDDSTANPKLYDNVVINITVNSTLKFSSVSFEVPANLVRGAAVQLCEVQIYSEDHDCQLPSSTKTLLIQVREGTGYVNGEKNLVSTGTVLEFMCSVNYNLEGNASLTCQENRQYDVQVPSCVEIRCEQPDDIHNGNYAQSLQKSFSVGDVVQWECNLGYRSDQNRTRQCLPLATWSGEQPVCVRIVCFFPNTFPNGHLENETSQEYTHGPIGSGTEIQVVCEVGFRPNISTITCQDDSTWDALPGCVQVVCGPLESLTGGRYIYNGHIMDGLNEVYVYGTIATAICNETLFRLSKEMETMRSCGQNGTWSGHDELCVSLCEVPMPNKGMFKFNDTKADQAFYELGQELMILCEEGYEFEGQSTRTIACRRNHSWDPITTVCVATDEGNSSVWGAAVGGGIGAAVIVLACLAIVVVFVLRRRREKLPSMGVSSRMEAPTDGIINYVNEDQFSKNSKISTEDQTESYYNIAGVKRVPDSAIRLSDLADVVIAADAAAGRFDKQFQAFQEGMKRPHLKALQNLGKNRYKNLYAYDDTRVLLDIWDSEADTDYINACFIHGFHEPKTYIASQGPVKDILDDFWRMVWQQNCTKIVMLTNLMEDGKMKCKQYWPDSGTQTYGRVTVTLENTEIYANFLVRTLTVTKDEEQRQVLQFHFTSWPDKDVPYFCSSLVHFRSKVKAAHTVSKGPILVHCSAGIGRTGTFIAIDFLVDQAERLDYVDVVGCVEALRQQRVNMVQTKKQYVFVHLALVEILVLKTSVVPTSRFENTYQELLTMDTAKRKRKLEIEFEILCGMLLGEEDNKQKDQVDKTKIRYSNILPKIDFMPSLSRPGRYMFGEFINAAFLPAYKEANAMIITQTPLETTVCDFWNLVLHQDIHTIVMMNQSTELTQEEIYWPETNERKMFDTGINIRNKGVVKQGGHTILTLFLKTKNKEREVKLIQFEKWGQGQTLPETPDQVLSALDLVEEHQRHTGNKPVIVHCMDGVEKSGLFCVVAALLDRLKVEQEVAISQVIQEMRNRRPNIIPNFEQFRFCHEIVLAFLRQFDTYSNFECNT